MITRFAVRSLCLVAVAAWSLAAGSTAEAGIRGNAYRVTSDLLSLPYDAYYFTPFGQGPYLSIYLELDYGLFSLWTSQGLWMPNYPGPTRIDHVGISLLGLTISGTRIEYRYGEPLPRLAPFSGYLDPRCGPSFERERIRGFNTGTKAVWIIAEGEPLSAATYVRPNTQRIIDVQLPQGAQEVRFFAVLDAPGYPTVGQGIWRPDVFATTQILWNGEQLICNPQPPLP